MAERLLTGAVAPGFTLKDSSGQDVSLNSGRGANTIVYFYPAASTPGCTKQACDFRDNLASFTASWASPPIQSKSSLRLPPMKISASRCFQTKIML